MQTPPLRLGGAALVPRPSGVLYWPAADLLAVADLHLGRAEAAVRRGQAPLPPYADRDTLDRLGAEVEALAPRTVLLLGDSFDDAAGAEDAAQRLGPAIEALATGRRLVWVTGNHDPRSVRGLPGDWCAETAIGPLAFRHIAAPERPVAGHGEISAHYHPKARLVCRGTPVRRRCFLTDGARAILPAFGTYTGGLDARDPAFDGLLGPETMALMLGGRIVAVPRARLD